MKMTYKKPEVLAVTVMHFESLLLSQSETGRGTAGGPTERTGQDGAPLPTTVGETDGETNPFGDSEGDHGQGAGNSGNRAKSSMIWDEW